MRHITRTLALSIFALAAAASFALSPVRAAEDRLILTNRAFDQITVEVRIGDAGEPSVNPLFGARTLARGETWTIPSNGQTIYYRRELTPGVADGQYTQWVPRNCYGLGATYEEDVQ